MNTATPTKVQVFCGNGLKSVFATLEHELAAKAGASIATSFASTKVLVDRINGGEIPDVAILTDETIDVLIAQGKLVGPRVDIATAAIGVAVRKGASRPDIITTARFVQLLRVVSSIARSKQGISGLHFADIVKQLGLTDAIASKINIIEGHAGQACANGETEIAIQQISELMPVAGIDIVGPLPDELQKITMVSAGVSANSRARAAAEAVIAYIKSQKDVLRSKGLEPA